jgi:hypothetical protein
MSWKIINRIIGLASIDPEFREALQREPLETLEAEGFELTPEEQEIFATCTKLPFSEFCQHLIEKLGPDQENESRYSRAV